MCGVGRHQKFLQRLELLSSYEALRSFPLHRANLLWALTGASFQNRRFNLGAQGLLKLKFAVQAYEVAVASESANGLESWRTRII